VDSVAAVRESAYKSPVNKVCRIAALPPHIAESLWLSGEAITKTALEAKPPALIITGSAAGKPEAYRYVLRQRRRANFLSCKIPDRI
jgi:hypothetical protein